jgi:hypothetical protein
LFHDLKYGRSVVRRKTMDDKTKKQKRADIFKTALDKDGVPDWGRGAAIVELCDLYHIDLYLWVTLESRGESQVSASMTEAIIYVKQFDERTAFTLTPEQFAHMCLVYLDTEKREGLASVVEVLSKKTDAPAVTK